MQWEVTEPRTIVDQDPLIFIAYKYAVNMMFFRL